MTIYPSLNVFFKYFYKLFLQTNFTQIKKQEIHLHYVASGNYAETGRTFGLNESTVPGVVCAHPIADKRLSSKENVQRGGRLLSYPVELEDEMLKWILVLRDLHFPVSVLGFQEKAKKLIQPHNPSFSASRGWVTKFFARHKLALRARISISQKLPRQLEGVLTKFY